MTAGLTSVVIPLFNGAAWIGAALRSAVRQRSAPREILVVDDGSTDGSPELARAFPGVTVLPNPRKGANAARVHGLSAAAGPYVALLDQDDVWHEAHLARLEQLAEQYPSSHAFVGGAVLFSDGTTPQIGEPGDTSEELDPWRRFPTVAIATPSQVLIRRDVLLQRGGWEERFPGLADHHAWLRLSADQPLRALRSATMGYRQHAASYSSALRRHDAFGFARRFLAASADVLPLRASFGNAGSAFARLRLSTLMLDWLEASAGRKADASDRARLLDRELALHEPDLVSALWRQLFYFLLPATGRDHALARGLLAARTLCRAPLGCRRVRRSLARIILAKLLRTVGFAPPWEQRPISAPGRSPAPSVGAP